MTLCVCSLTETQGQGLYTFVFFQNICVQVSLVCFRATKIKNKNKNKTFPTFVYKHFSKQI